MRVLNSSVSLWRQEKNVNCEYALILWIFKAVEPRQRDFCFAAIKAHAKTNLISKRISVEILRKRVNKNTSRDVAIYLARDPRGEIGVDLVKYFCNIFGVAVMVRCKKILD